MLAAWTEILPLFVVRWLARRYCGTIEQGGIKCFDARPGVLIFAAQRAQAQKEQSNGK